MGILDDAIREHLELKRSHGANEDEIRRKEAEAFGAARQEVTAEAPPDEHTQLLQPEDAPVPDSPEHGHVSPGDAPIPDPHDHAHPAGSDPAWGDDTELFSEPVHAAHESEPSPAAEAGAGTLEPTETQAGPPFHHHEDEQHPALVDHDHIGGEEHPPEPVFRHAAEAPTAPPPETPVEEPPVEEPPVEEPGEGDEDEDVLEETPEFLQDAPEHDRLWFEQKPPRDFDFGE